MDLITLEMRRHLSQDLRDLAQHYFNSDTQQECLVFVGIPAALSWFVTFCDYQYDPYALLRNIYKEIGVHQKDFKDIVVDWEQYAYFCLLMAEYIEDISETNYVKGHRIYRDGKLIEQVEYTAPIPFSLWNVPYL